MLIILMKVLHITVAIFLILVVLLQTGKGAEMGAAFGGSSNTVFGSGGPAGFMAKLTTAAAVCFMLTSLGLAYVSSTARTVSAVTPGQQAPASLPAQSAFPPAEGTAQDLPSAAQGAEQGAPSGEGAPVPQAQ